LSRNQKKGGVHAAGKKKNRVKGRRGTGKRKVKKKGKWQSMGERIRGKRNSQRESVNAVVETTLRKRIRGEASPDGVYLPKSSLLNGSIKGKYTGGGRPSLEYKPPGCRAAGNTSWRLRELLASKMKRNLEHQKSARRPKPKKTSKLKELLLETVKQNLQKGVHVRGIRVLPSRIRGDKTRAD